MNDIEKSAHRARILCVDDETSWLVCLSEILLRAGYSCQCCNSAEDAYRTVAQHVPDLILADIDLGEDNGLVLCEQLRSLPGATAVPVLFVSGADIPDIVQRAREAGGTYYLRKPFDPEALLDLIETALWMPHVVRSSRGTRRETVSS